MAETNRQKNKIKLTIAEHLIPEIAEFGTTWLAKDSDNVWWACKSGVVVNLTDLLNSQPVLLPVRHGRDGKDGLSIKGERGPAGRDGQSIVGPAGQSIVGPQGPKGEPGDITVVGDAELLAAVNVLKAKHAQFLAALQIQLERNAGRKHSGLQRTIDSVLQSLKSDAGL